MYASQERDKKEDGWQLQRKNKQNGGGRGRGNGRGRSLTNGGRGKNNPNNSGGRGKGKTSSPPCATLAPKFELHKLPTTIKYEVHEPVRSACKSNNPGIFYSSNVMYVCTGDLKYDDVYQVTSVVVDMANEVHRQITGRYEDGNYKVNMPTNFEGRTMRHCYVWIASSALASLICGYNIDGTERVELTPDPKWVPPAPKEASYSPSSSSDRWCDFSDEEDEEPQPPMVKIYLQGLVNRVFIYYQRSEGEVSTSPYAQELGVLMNYGLSFSQLPGERYQSHVLFASLVPSSISDEVIRASFAPYATDGSGKYPEVKHTRGSEGMRNIFVTYNYTTNDAAFALQMMMRSQFTPTGWTEGSPKVTLLFQYALMK